LFNHSGNRVFHKGVVNNRVFNLGAVRMACKQP